MGRPAIFFDRDGVLVEDVDSLVAEKDIRILPGAATLVAGAHRLGFVTVVISNQTVVARGLASEAEVAAVNDRINAMIEAEGGGRIERFYVCPHHPNASLPAYRRDCECRKPRPGLLLKAAEELHLDLSRSIMVGDRMTDIMAGSRAGCGTILIQSGKHAEPLIQSAHHDLSVVPDHVCRSPAEALDILIRSGRA